MTNHQEFLDKAMLDPGDIYRLPDEVAKDERLNKDEQLAVLKNWADDIRQILDAGNENMKPKQTGPGEADLLRAIDKEIEAFEQ